MLDVGEEPSGQERRHAHFGMERMIEKVGVKALRREGQVIEKVLFVIGNRHFLIRKCHFGIGAGPYVQAGRYADEPFLFLGATPMIRRRLLTATAIIASVVLAACSDMTGPKNDSPCPVVTGSGTCTN
jgi:hypothetical protein